MRNAVYFTLLTIAVCVEPVRGQSSDARVDVKLDRLQDIPLGDVRWTDGLLYRRLEACRQGSMPSMTRIMQGVEYSQFIENFRVASGRAQGRRRGPAWNDGDCYKWLEAAAALYATFKDPHLDQVMDQAIDEIAAAQRDDGYLHTPIQFRARQLDATALPFSDALQFELYNLGHLMTSACVHHRATGKTTLLSIAIKAADYLDRTFRGPQAPLGRSAICPSHYMGLVELSRETGNKSYVELARFLIDRRDRVQDGTDDNQDRLPFRQQRAAVGHAVRANYLYAGVADLVPETGDRELLNTLEILWRDVNQHKIYITGACGALYDGASPDGSDEQKSISRTHQAFGRAYQLPNSTAHNESCASVGNMLWNWRMLRLTRQAKYADALERTIYNALLATVSLDGRKYFYTNTLRQLDVMPTDLRWSRQREEFISCFCCPPNIVRSVAQLHQYAHSLSTEALWIHLYGANELDTRLADGQRLHIIQQTDYPWKGAIRFSISAAPQGEFGLHFRIPAWTESATIKINGTPVRDTVRPEEYTRLTRVWSAGDVVELEFPMRAKLIAAHPLVEEVRNQVAVLRGPIVYCLESPDLPNGTQLLYAAIDPAASFSETFLDDFLGGVSVLETDMSFLPSQSKDAPLYRPADLGPARQQRVKLIPYFAWQNRGQSEMSVWLPWLRN